MFLFSKRVDDFSHLTCIVRVSTSFAALLLAVRTSTSRSLRHPKKQKWFSVGQNKQNRTNLLGGRKKGRGRGRRTEKSAGEGSLPNPPPFSLPPYPLPLSTPPTQAKIERDLSVVYPARNHVTSLSYHQSLSACKDGGYRQ